jgi:peptidoglycan/xylan/chitin deacetylase (PgdA/CDA1 family)
MIRAVAGAGLVAGAVLHAGPALAPIVPGVGPALGIRHRLDRAGGVALTFDDGPHPQGTASTLEILREAGAPATFFLSGEQVERRPALAADIVAAGHGVGLHCHRHRNMLRLGPGQVRADAERGRALIEEATARPVALHRPPYGIYSGSGLGMVRSRGWEPVLWSRWGRDWARGATAESITRRSTGGLREGDILLLHDADYYSVPDCWRNTVAALPLILAEIERRGLKILPLEFGGPGESGAVASSV